MKVTWSETGGQGPGVQPTPRVMEQKLVGGEGRARRRPLCPSGASAPISVSFGSVSGSGLSPRACLPLSRGPSQAESTLGSSTWHGEGLKSRRALSWSAPETPH